MRVVLAPDFRLDPIGALVTRVAVLTVGMIWQFVLAMIIVYRKEGDLRWATVRRRLWLNAPRDSRTGQTSRILWLWLVPLLILVVLLKVVLAPALNDLWVLLFPFFAEPGSFAMGTALESPEVQVQLVGAWGIVALFVVFLTFNSFLGEELLLRGVLLQDERRIWQVGLGGQPPLRGAMRCGKIGASPALTSAML